LGASVDQGYSVRRMVSACSALLELHTREFQAVILDLALPDADGLDLIRKIRMEFHWLKIAVISGAVVDHTVPLIRSAGADAAQVKPIDLDRMRTLVNRLLYPALCWTDTGSPESEPGHFRVD
jgi:DNA-binding response OmpR family regulator